MTEQELSSSLPNKHPEIQPSKAFYKTNSEAIENTTLLHHTPSVQTTCTPDNTQNANQNYGLPALRQEHKF